MYNKNTSNKIGAMNKSDSLNNCTTLQQFESFMEKGFEKPELSTFWGARVVKVEDRSLYLTSIVDKFIELRDNRDSDPTCSLPRLTKQISNLIELSDKYATRFSRTLSLPSVDLTKIKKCFLDNVHFNTYSKVEKTKAAELFVDNIDHIEFNTDELAVRLYQTFTFSIYSYPLDGSRQMTLLRKYFSMNYMEEDLVKQQVASLSNYVCCEHSHLSKDQKFELFVWLAKNNPEIIKKFVLSSQKIFDAEQLREIKFALFPKKITEVALLLLTRPIKQ